MKIRTFLIATVAAASLAAPALADTISSGIWYDAGFNGTGTPLFGPGFSIGFDQPAGTGVAFAPTTPWTITLSKPETLTIVDTETSGDQFTMFNNGNPLGTTSTPCDSCSSGIGNDIGLALADADYSVGRFLLPAGTDTISGTFDGVIGFGDADFEIAGVPEPATWAMLLGGLGAIGAGMRMRRKTATVLA
jgi:hypothetical protein